MSKPNDAYAKNDKKSEGVIGVPIVRLNDFRTNRVIVKIKACDFK